jgi:hypothetical protein
MSNVQHDVTKVATLPSHIENVYERGITCLDENQQKSYKDLLVEFQTIYQIVHLLYHRFLGVDVNL